VLVFVRHVCKINSYLLINVDLSFLKLVNITGVAHRMSNVVNASSVTNHCFEMLYFNYLSLLPLREQRFGLCNYYFDQ